MNTARYNIDLNCDMGEGLDTDKDIMSFISSANIACGYHAGDEATIKRTVDLCLQYNVAIGAHPGFDDKINFGRTAMNLNQNDLYHLVTKQVQLVKAIAEGQGGQLHHVKPHGALYNMAATDPAYANVLARAVKDIDASLIYYGLSNSVMISAAEAIGLQVAAEVFADRTYLANGQLSPRSQPGALITDANAAIHQVLQLAKEGVVQAISGEVITLPADTLCLHGDGTHAVTFAERISRELKVNGITVNRIEKSKL